MEGCSLQVALKVTLSIHRWVCRFLGTLTFGIETEDGSFHEVTRSGSFPTGPVRVVFADHNYTPTKDEPSDITFTWHWDNITVLG